MARYLIVKIKDDSRGHGSAFGRVRKALHDLSREEDIGLSDFGTNMDLVTKGEKDWVEQLFERVLLRAKKRQKMFEEISRERRRDLDA